MLIAWTCSMFNILCNQPASALSPNFQSEQLCSALNSSRLLSWPRAVASGCSLIPAITSHKIYHMFLTRNHQQHWSTPTNTHGFWLFIIIYHHLWKLIKNHQQSLCIFIYKTIINNHYLSSFIKKKNNNHYLSSCKKTSTIIIYHHLLKKKKTTIINNHYVSSSYINI